MIHIDELFRQRMEDREASPKPGAWSNMRELLDKEMPVAAKTTNWRRVFGYFTGLLLLASASVGGYSLYTGQLQSGAGTAPVALRASNTRLSSGPRHTGPLATVSADAGHSYTASAATDNIPGQKNATGRHTHAEPQQRAGHSAQQATSAHGTDRTGRYASASAITATTNPDRATTPVAAPNATATISASAGTRPPSSGDASDRSRTSASTHKKNLFSSVPRRKRDAGNPQPGTSAPAALNTVAGAPSRSAVAPKLRTPGHPLASSAKPAPLTLNSTARSRAGQTSAPHENEELSLQSGTPANRRPDPVLRVLDTIRRIEIVTRRSFVPGAGRSGYRLDTLPAEYVVVERMVSLSQPKTESKPDLDPKLGKRARRRQEKAAADQMLALGAKPAAELSVPKVPEPTLNAASANAKSIANEAAAGLSGTKLGFWKSLRLDERVQNAKTSLQSIELYPGVMGGINATVLTPNALGGFQFGLSALLAINDWWSIQAEAKYFYRFNTGSSLRDDFLNVRDTSTSYSTISGTNYVSRSWSEAKVSHNFNYEAVQTLEVPVMLRYNNNRFFTQFGLNFVSSRPIAAREVTSDPSEFKPVTSGLAPANQPNLVPFPTNTQANIRMADFGNRFGVGYAIGAGYSFTQAVYFDLRLTQTFWDNAKTDGARQISKELLRNPSFQLSLGYRFGMAKRRD